MDAQRIAALLYPEKVVGRPRTRADCVNGVRPCPYVGCRHHLYLDINQYGNTVKINFPDLEPWELTHSCSLDVAAIGGVTLESVGGLVNITRERVRQIQDRTLLRIKPEMDDEDLIPS